MALLSPFAGYCNAGLKASKKHVSEADLLNDLQRGEWLNKDYIKKLKSTKSPQKAVENIAEDSFLIKKDQNGYLISVIYNFHEGGEPFTVTGLKEIAGKKGIYELLVNVPADITEKKSRFTLIKSKEQDEIQWSYENNHKNIKHTFVRVEPSVAVFVNRVLLAGDYKDEKGRSFVFTESGLAKWPGKDFRFETILDYVGSPPSCDLLMEVDEHGRYSNPSVLHMFEWKGDTLLIYKVDNSGDMSTCDKKAIYKLRRTK